MMALINLALVLLIGGMLLALIWTLRQLHLEIAGQDDDLEVLHGD